MDREAALNILREKHLILCDGAESARRGLVDEIKNGVSEEEFEIFDVPFHVRTRHEFVDTVKYVFPIKSPMGTPVRSMFYVQIADVLLDWTETLAKSTFVIWEEVGEFEPKKDLYGFFNDFVTQKYMMDVFNMKQTVRLLATCDRIIDDYFDSTTIYVGRGEDDPLTDEEVARQNLEIVVLD